MENRYFKEWGVQELSTTELQKTNGGLIIELAAILLGAAIGYVIYHMKNDPQAPS